MHDLKWLSSVVLLLTLVVQLEADDKNEVLMQAAKRIVACGGKLYPVNGEEVTSISFWVGSVTDADLETIQEFKRLRILTFTGSNHLKGEGVAFLSTLANLEVLRFQDCDDLTDTALKFAATIKNLRIIEVAKCSRITGQGLKELGNLGKLDELILITSPGLKSSDLKQVRVLDKLKRLSVTDVTTKCIDDTVIESWAEMTGLEMLDLSGARITADGVKFFTQSALRDLRLSHCSEIGDDALKQLASCNQLTHLELSACGTITNIGLTHVSKLQNLQSLKLTSYPEIGDDGMAALAGLKNLRKLELYTQHTKITQAGLKALQSKLPQLEISNMSKTP